MDESPELTIYSCDRPKSFAKLIEIVEQKFPGVPLDELEVLFGIVSITVKPKE